MRRDIKRAPRRLFVVCLAFVSAFGLRASLISPNLGEKKHQRQRNRGSREEERAPMSNVEKGRHSSPAPSRSSLSKWRRSGMRFINAAVWRVPRNVPSTSSINQFSRIKKKTFHDLQCPSKTHARWTAIDVCGRAMALDKVSTRCATCHIVQSPVKAKANEAESLETGRTHSTSQR